MKLTVYSKSVCPYCVHAKQYLENNNIEFEDIDIEKVPEAREFIFNRGHRTVPQIYYRGILFVEGGWEGLKKLNAEQIMREIENHNEMLNANVDL